MMQLIARVVAATTSLFASFAICFGSSLLFLMFAGQIAGADRFVLYGWTAAGLGALLALLLCGIQPKWKLLPAVFVVAALAISLPLLRFIDGSHSTFGRVIRWGVFLTHLPACGIFGTLLAMPTFQWLRGLIDE